MNKREAIEAAKALGRQIDQSRGHRFYAVKDRGREIDLVLDETVQATWTEQPNGLYERTA